MQCAHCDVEHAPVNLLKGRSGQEDARDAVTWTVACTVALWSSCCFMDYTFESESALSLSLSLALSLPRSFSPSSIQTHMKVVVYAMHRTNACQLAMRFGIWGPWEVGMLCLSLSCRCQF